MFIHLHNHFEGSYSDSSLTFEEGIRKVARLGQKAVALTDHGELAFPWKFHDVCRSHGVKPLFGAELYFVNDAKRSIEKQDNERYHLVALAKDLTGLTNLYRILSDSWVENSYKERRGLADWSLLEKYHDGIIMLSGCYYNFLAFTIARKGMAAAEKVLARFRDIFGEDYYVEIGRHLIAEEDKVNGRLLELAKRFAMTPVATNDAHYLDPAGKFAHDVIMRTRTGKALDIRANSDQYWLKDETEMRALGLPEEFLKRSEEVAEKCGDIVLAPEPEKKPVKIKNAAKLLAAGEAAYVSDIIRIDRETAERQVREVFKGAHPELADDITGIPRRSEPDPEHLACTPGRKIGEVIPLKRSAGKICTQWDADSCKKAGALIVPARTPSFVQRLFSFLRK